LIFSKTIPLSLSACVLIVACGDSRATSPSAATSTAPPVASAPQVPAPPPVPDVTFAGAGDIVRCNEPEGELTARLLDRIPGTVFSLGDNVYPATTTATLSQCYTPTWGRHVPRMLAVAGNHDWEVSAGAAYFAYFGAASGPPPLGYYSTTIGAWHVVALNSNLPAGAGSAQYEWLKADLAANPAACTLAMWHHPLFSSGTNGNSPQMREVWRLLHAERVELVLNGHDHDYERFAPQDAEARLDATGPREFVVGTGGASLYTRDHPQPNTEVWENRTFGVLKLTLKTGGYDWRFVPIDGQSFSDGGSAACIAAR
jgi:calcineurin-like phosphoesterase family protein